MRAAFAILVCCFGCDGGSRAAPPSSASPPVEVILQGGAGQPRLEIQATFDVDPKPHIQPITATLAGARASCAGKPGLAATLSIEIRDKRVHATARNTTAACLARAIDGIAIDDPTDYGVELRVSST